METHVTVAHDAGDDPPDRLARWAAARGHGFTHIALARGRHRSQPMVTLRGRARADTWIAGPVARMVEDLARGGFDAVRTKTETSPWATGVPGTDEEARRLAPHLHFEHHVKMLLDPGADRRALADRAVGHAAHLSWNARRTRPDGLHERFVTQRCHGAGRTTAERRLDALLTALAAVPGATVLEIEREYVLQDTHLGLDAGWIAAGPEPTDPSRTDPS
ncbi:hypothetical protein G3I40_01645 [Streptomyces sp. SID14478]|nr:hypothetical protein [Streptomyces sp. SID14478]